MILIPDYLAYIICGVIVLAMIPIVMYIGNRKKSVFNKVLLGVLGVIMLGVFTFLM